jgi:hypothetical protein
VAKANVRIYRTLAPAGWAWSFDRTDIQDSGIDNFATAANPNAALDAVKPLISAMPGTLSTVDMKVDTFEPAP